MFFAKRRWSLRVIEQMGESSSTLLATELIDMIIQGAKQYQEMSNHTGQKLSDPELVLIATAVMARNQSARTRLLEIGISPEDAQSIFNRALQAGRELADTEGYTDIVQRIYDRTS